MLEGVPSPFHVHLVAPSNEDSTYIKPLWVATPCRAYADDVELTFRDDGLDPSISRARGDAPNLVGISVNSKTAAACVCYRRRVPRSGEPGRTRRNPRHRAPGRSDPARRRGRERRGRMDLAGRRTRRPLRQARTRALLAPARALQTRRIHAARGTSEAEARSRQVDPLRPLRRRPDHARLPVPVRVLQRFDIQRDKVSLPSGVGGGSPSSRRAARASSSVTTTS